MAWDDAYRAIGRSGAFSRSVRAPRSSEAGRSRSARHRIHLREIDSKDRRHRRLCRCLEAALLRLGIQGQAPQPGSSLCAVEAIRRRARNPPLLIVSDMQEIRVHTNFTNTIAQQHVIPLAELRSVEARELLRNCFLHPERLLPTATRESITAQAAAKFANIAVCCAGNTTNAASRISSTSWYSASSPRISSCCPTASSPTSSTRR